MQKRVYFCCVENIAFIHGSSAGFITCIAAPLKAQVYTKARAITVQDSLSDNRVTCFYKDKTGFVWIGTKNGLNRYDGLRIKIFLPAAGNSISNEVINDIAEDSRGNIWVATMDGLNVYHPAVNKWEVFYRK